MLIMISGGRRYFDTGVINRTMNQLLKEFGSFTVLTGGASGADNLVAHWADEHNIQKITIKAEWDLYKHAAGPIRNKKMIEMKPNLVILFPGGKGTLSAGNLAREAGIPVRVIDGNVEAVVINRKKD